MKPLISVILPIYNVEDCLPRCIESVIRQTYTNLEILLVDDGSSDGCGKICDKYAKEDNRIRVIHKSNGGLSDARNQGAQIASGQYITFIDSDDYVTDTYVEYLFNLLEKYHTRMSLCTHTIVFESGKNIKIGQGGDEIQTSEQCLERMLYDDVINTSAWAKLYEAEMVRRFPYPVGKLFEDIATTYKFFMSCDKIACGYENHYFYMLRNTSIVYQKFNSKKMELLEMTDIMAGNVIKEYPQLSRALERRQVYARFSTLNQMQDVTGYQEEKRMLIQYIKQHKACIIENPKAPKRDKLALLVLSMGYPLYRLCWKIVGK
mgnify:CR=1 FL=1